MKRKAARAEQGQLMMGSRTRQREILIQGGIFAIATVTSWYVMMAPHETGHCAAAWGSGGAITSVDIPLLGFSQTHCHVNPRPLFVAWAGPAGASLLALLLAGIAQFLPGLRKQVLLYYGGFSLIANGLYIGLGAFERVGDCATLLNHGAQVWQLVAFGTVMTILGAFCWHRMGPLNRWFVLAAARTLREIAPNHSAEK
jgi:hypothetical protein